MSGSVRQQGYAFSQDRQRKLFGMDCGKYIARGEFVEDIGACILLAGPRKLDEVRMEQGLHAIPVAASFVRVHFCFELF